jgi:hypothetical protein
MQNPESANDIVSEFMKLISADPNLDKDVTNLLNSLHDQSKFTDNNIQNGLEEIRKRLLNENTENTTK